MLRHLTRFLFILALVFFASGVIEARIQIRVPQNDIAVQKLTLGIFSLTTHKPTISTACQAV
jgi:uncharacterized membrane protein HdeD (DUF308 family)